MRKGRDRDDVKDVMNRNVKTVHLEESVRHAAHIMNENRIGALVVISGSGCIAGIVTERDILSNVVATGRSANDVKVSEIMSPPW
jgi:CBS domain-containing protein